MRKTGRKLLNFDRRLGARFVAGADEAGRGSLAGPLVTAAVLFDYEVLRDHKVRPLAILNDSKQLTPGERARLFRAVMGCATRIAVRIIPPAVIDSDGLHRSNLRGLRETLADLSPPAEVCLVDGFRLGPLALEHRAVVDGDTRSAAIAAASIVAKVTRDRLMVKLARRYRRYGWESNKGYGTPEHAQAIKKHGVCTHHRRSFSPIELALQLLTQPSEISAPSP